MVGRPNSVWSGLAAAVVAACGLAASGCADDDRPALGPWLTVPVRHYTGEPARGVPVSVLGGPSATVGINGQAGLLGVPAGPGVAAIGDSRTTPTLLLPFTAAGLNTFAARTVHLPSFESGVAATVPASVVGTLTVDGAALPGVSLRLDPGTSVASPTGDVRVIPVSPSRLPVAIAGAGEPRAAFLVEPHGVTFAPAATLTIPRLDANAAQTFDCYKVDRATGDWVLHLADVPLVNGSECFEVPVDDGTLYAVAPRTVATTVTVTGRVVAGARPLAGYRASCWNRVSAPTGSDGTFSIPDVPTNFSLYLLRVYPAEPGFQYAPEMVQATSANPAFSDLTVAARPADRLRPTVRATSPADDATNVDRRSHIVVTFSEAIDPARPEVFEVVGPKGKVDGVYQFDNATAVRFRPTDVLEPSDTYTILVDRTAQDLAGNPIDDSTIAFRFTTQGGSASAPPTDTLIYGLRPRSGAIGDTVTLFGRNFTGGTSVSFGGASALVLSETSDELRVEVPDYVPAGDVSVVAYNPGTIPSLAGLSFDLRATVTGLREASGGTALTVLDRASPPSALLVDGHDLGGAAVTLDGIPASAVDVLIVVGSSTVASVRSVTLGNPAADTIVGGPVVLWGQNGEPSETYRFLFVRD